MPHLSCLKVALDSSVHVNINGAASEEVRDDDNSVPVLDIDEDGLLIFAHGDLHSLLLGAIHINMHGRRSCVHSHMVAVGFDVDWDQCTVDDRHGCFRATVQSHHEEAQKDNAGCRSGHLGGEPNCSETSGCCVGAVVKESQTH